MAHPTFTPPSRPGARSYLAADKILEVLRARGVDALIPRSEVAKIVHECTDFSKTLNVLSDCATFLCDLPCDGEPLDPEQAEAGEKLSREVLKLISEARASASSAPIPEGK